MFVRQLFSEAQLIEAIDRIEATGTEPTVKLRCGRPSPSAASGICNRILDAHLGCSGVLRWGSEWWPLISGSTTQAQQREPLTPARGRTVRPSIRMQYTSRTAADRGVPNGPTGIGTDRVRYVCKCGADYAWRPKTLAAAWVEAVRAGQREIIAGVDVA